MYNSAIKTKNKKGHQMKNANFFKANINEAELPKFLAELNEIDGACVDFSYIDIDDTSNEWFFANIVRSRDVEEKLFTKEAREIIDNYAAEYNITLYRDDESDSAQKVILKAEKNVWGEYTSYIKSVIEYFYFSAYRLYTESDYAEQRNMFERLDSKISKYQYIYYEIDDDFYEDLHIAPENFELYEEIAPYEMKNLGENKIHTYRWKYLNDNRIDVVKAVKEIRKAVNDLNVELDKFLNVCDDEQEVEGINMCQKPRLANFNKVADELIKKAEIDCALIDNKPNFKYIYDEEVAPFERDFETGKEIW